MLGFEVNLLLRFDVEVELLIRFALVDGLRIPEANVAICACADYFLFVVADELHLALVARLFWADGHH